MSTHEPRFRYESPPPWLTAAEAGVILGMSKQALHQRLEREPDGGIETMTVSAPHALRRMVVLKTADVLNLRAERQASGKAVGPLPWPELPPHPPEVPPVPPMPTLHGIGLPTFRPF